MSDPENWGTAFPSGPLDTLALAKLASEFFAALPGAAPAGTPPQPAQPESLTLPGAPVPSLPFLPSLTSGPSALQLPADPLSASQPQGVFVGAQGAPASPGRPVPAAPAVPSGPSALQLPVDPLVAPQAEGGSVGPRSVPAPPGRSIPFAPDTLAGRLPLPAASPAHSNHYYFLSGLSAQEGLPASTFVMPDDDRVTALPFGLPGSASLVGLIPDAAPALLAPTPAATSPATDSPRAVRQPDGLEPAGRYNETILQSFDVGAVRRDFPILSERVNGQPLVWFDNAATTQKPSAVIDRLSHFYKHENSNIHRAAHELAARATDAYEHARETVRRFIGARSTEEIIFVRGATEAINLVAKRFGAAQIQAADEIIVSHLEHHANIVPWQQLAQEKGARIRVIPVNDRGEVLLEQYARLLNPRTRIVAVTQVSNALGTLVPVQQIVAMAHAAGAYALVDGAQSVSHMRVDVTALDADFFVFSGHKIFGPTGIGVVYGKRAILEGMPPWQGGGNMIADVTFERTIFQPPPARFEAGTGNIADAVGLGAALEYVERIGIDAIGAYEHALLDYATEQLCTIKGLCLIGTARQKASVLSFVLEGYSTEEVGSELNRAGIAVRAGHHCAQPILRRFGLEKTVRASLAFYNTCEEVDKLVVVLRRLAAVRP